MKLIPSILTIFLCTQLFGQPIILSQKEAQAKGIKVEKLTELYNPEQSNPGAVAFFETPYSVQARIGMYYRSIVNLDEVKDVIITSSIYIGENGRVDYLIYSFFSPNAMPGTREFPVNMDSLSVIIDSKMPALIEGFNSKRNLGSKTLFHTSTGGFGWNPRRTAEVKKDSTISNLSEALAARDTLKIKTLILSKSLLAAVPDVIYRFPNLELLSLADNDIEEANLDMSKLPKLQHLDLVSNLLNQESIRLSKNKSLKMLLLQKNQLTDVPPAVRNCKRLETLWLGGNRITALNNDSFRKMKKLRDLNLYKAGVTSLPEGVRKMKHLEVLDLYYNNLERLPKSIIKLKRLTHLAVSYNQLSFLPPKIDKMKSVHTLYAHHNHLSKLPKRITRMRDLKIVDLGYNWFTNFPSELVSFSSLEELDLSSNNFTEFPMQLLSLKRLDKLYLRGNPFARENAEVKYGQQLGQLKNKNIEVFY